MQSCGGFVKETTAEEMEARAAMDRSEKAKRKKRVDAVLFYGVWFLVLASVMYLAQRYLG